MSLSGFVSSSFDTLSYYVNDVVNVSSYFGLEAQLLIVNVVGGVYRRHLLQSTVPCSVNLGVDGGDASMRLVGWVFCISDAA